LSLEIVRKAVQKLFGVRIDFLLISDDLERTLMTLYSGLQKCSESCSISVLSRLAEVRLTHPAQLSGCNTDCWMGFLIY